MWRKPDQERVAGIENSTVGFSFRKSDVCMRNFLAYPMDPVTAVCPSSTLSGVFRIVAMHVIVPRLVEREWSASVWATQKIRTCNTIRNKQQYEFQFHSFSLHFFLTMNALICKQDRSIKSDLFNYSRQIVRNFMNTISKYGQVIPNRESKYRCSYSFALCAKPK
jgi:hypothetical protein